ncbi:hypothetical protein [Microbacterium foliorum]|uniref:hypothetical protein n=1 Tax=Microbacterium foliorum TaxID=104336 RepID=UPI0028D16F94|nr:hypothetical protein [Microbacterium foliorum]
MTAVLLALLGVFGLAATGLAWSDGRLQETTSYDPSEAGIGAGVAWVTWVTAAVLLLFAVVSALRQAQRERDRRGYYIALATLVPLGSAVVIAAGWFILLDPGGATFAP